MEDKNNLKKTLIILVLVLMLVGMLGGAFAYTPISNFTDKFPIQVMPKIGGFMQPDDSFDYVFTFSKDDICVDITYTTAVNIATDKYGVGATELDLSTMTEVPSFLCEYRDGNLRKVHPMNERLFLEQITEQDIDNYGFIKVDTNTQLNESQVDSFVSNNGYILNESDPTVTLQKLQNLTFNDFHNLGGVDEKLNQSEIESMGFSIIDNDYCSGGVCNGDLYISGDLTLIGSITNVNATDVKANGSLVPEYNGVFDIGSPLMNWNNIYANTLYGNVDYSQLQNVPSFLLSESDPTIGSTLSGQWCRGTGSQIVCDVSPIFDTTLTDTDIFTMGYIKTFNENDPIFTASASSGITMTDISNWIDAYSWGNHQNYGYITDSNDAVDSNELDNLCNTNNMILKRINNTWGCSNDVGFVPVDLLVDYGFNDNSINWDLVYSDYYNNTNNYLTSYTENDPIFIGSVSYNINTTDLTNWNNAYVWGNHNIQGYITNESDPIFTTSPSYLIANSNISDWNLAYSWGDHNTNGYLTVEADPVFSASPSFNITNVGINNWNDAYNWGNHNLMGYLTAFSEIDPLFIASPSNTITTTQILEWNQAYNWGNPQSFGFITNFEETDQVYLADKPSIVFVGDTNLWDKNVSNDFDYEWSSLLNIPAGFLDGIDNNNQYFNLSEFVNDVGFITSYINTQLNESQVDSFVSNNGYLTNTLFNSITLNWDMNESNDFDYQWSSLLNIPAGFLDGIDDNTEYTNVSEFVNDVGYLTSYVDTNTQLNESQVDSFVSNNGYLTSFTELDPIFTSSDVFNVSTLNINNWNSAFGWSDHSLFGYLTSFTELDPFFTSSPSFNITNLDITNWNDVFTQVNNGGNSTLVFENDTLNWDKNVNDDFDYQWSSLLNIPLGFLDGIDDNTEYFNVSEFVNDANYITNLEEIDPIYTSSDVFGVNTSMIDNWNYVYNQINQGGNSTVVFTDDTDLWDKNVSDDFDYQWSSLLNVPVGFSDNVDNDTQYTNVTEFVNDANYITNLEEIDPIYTSSPAFNITQIDLDNWDAIHEGTISIYNPSTIEIVDEFMGYSTETGEIGNLGWSVLHLLSGYTSYEDSVSVLNNQHIGVLVCTGTSNKVNSGCVYSLGDSSVLSNNEKVGFILNALDPTYSVQRVGIYNQLSTPNEVISDGVYFRLDNSHSNVQGAVSYNSIEYTCDTGVSIIGTNWYKVEFEVDLLTDTINFYVNDVQTPSCSITNNLPENRIIGPKASFYTLAQAPTVVDVGMIDVFWTSYSAGDRWD